MKFPGQKSGSNYMANIDSESILLCNLPECNELDKLNIKAKDCFRRLRKQILLSYGWFSYCQYSKGQYICT